MIPEIDLDAFAAAQRDGGFVLDVREPSEYRAGHVPGAVLMPLAVLPVRAHELPKGRPLYVICQTGSRSYQAAAWLTQAGHQAVSVTGGTSAWSSAGHPTVAGADTA